MKLDFSKPRKLILIALDWGRPKDPPMSLGHASILATLYAYGIDVYPKSWSVNTPDFDVQFVLNFILENADSQADVALGAFIWNESYIQKILSVLKDKKFPGRIILGGPQVSYVKYDIEKYYPQADVFIRGYAEEVLAQFMLSSKQFPYIQGVHYANQPDLKSSATADLNKLPSPFLMGVIPAQRFIRWETQRGCPFRCSFCQHREADPSTKRREFSINRIHEEIDWITSSPIADIAVLDPTFNSGPHYLEILALFGQKKYAGKLALQCRIEMVKPEFLDLIENINQFGNVVLEFGLQTIHKNEQLHIQRLNNMQKVDDVFTSVQKRKIDMEVSLIFGLPGQTVDSFAESINFCKRYSIPKIYAFPLMLLRGTPLYDQKKQFGLIESSDMHFDEIPRIQAGIPHVVSSPSFSFSDWLKMAEIAKTLDAYNN